MQNRIRPRTEEEVFGVMLVLLFVFEFVALPVGCAKSPGGTLSDGRMWLLIILPWMFAGLIHWLERGWR